ncbi:MAG: redox-sensing transcriptional repressor Rex, partial [Synergistaceae bacterium]|nr:redox-sensing transcriptional repressor Rex [Synergistaceae bacterium]
EKIGKKIQGIPCFSLEEAPRIIRESGIEVVILTVPAAAAQQVADIVAEAGTVKGILNFAPVSLSVPGNMLLASVDISVELEKLLFFLKHKEDWFW